MQYFVHTLIEQTANNQTYVRYNVHKPGREKGSF